MKCTNKIKRYGCLLLLVPMLLTGCGAPAFTMPYDESGPVSSFKLVTIDDSKTAVPFAKQLCVADGNISNSKISMGEVGAAALFDLQNLDTLYAENVNTQIHPASLTKIMTALVAMKYGSMDQVLTASENVIITEPGAQLCGLKPGDSMTLDQALRILLINSANDAAILIAEGISGSVDAFVEQMNEEALRIGATNCQFLNPNGLTEEGHYVTAYDLYLIFNQALQYSLFNEIIQMPVYSTTYTDANGNEKNLEVKSTNQYIQGNVEMPRGITVIGGKTGTTNAAGHCLILLSKDNSGNSYISVVMNSSSTEDLYVEMTELLEAVY